MFGNLYKGKKVLVTGHTGFKGSWLSHWLLMLGADLTGFSIDIPSNPSNFEVLKLDKRLHHATGDVRDFEALTAVIQKTEPEIVFHLAAQSLVRKSYDKPKLTFDTNLGGTVNILEAIRVCPSVQAVLLITSDKCYENQEWPYGYRETDALGGRDPYSTSKACAELAFNAYFRSFFSGKTGPLLATVRAGNVIGGGDWSVDRIVPDCIRSWVQNEPVRVRNPESTRPWQHVLEPLSGYLWLGARLLQKTSRLSGEAFNFGPQPDVIYSVKDLIERMQKEWGQGEWVPLMDSTEHKPEASLLKLNCDKSLSFLNWIATLSYPETIQMTVEWYRKFYLEKGDMIKQTTEQILAYQKMASEGGLSWARP